MKFIIQAHALSSMLRENTRADSCGLSQLQLCCVLQSPLQRCGCPSASTRVQAAADPVAFESFDNVLLGIAGDHAETL